MVHVCGKMYGSIPLSLLSQKILQNVLASISVNVHDILDLPETSTSANTNNMS